MAGAAAREAMHTRYSERIGFARIAIGSGPMLLLPWSLSIWCARRVRSVRNRVEKC